MPKCPRHFGTGAEVSRGHFGTSAEMSWVRIVLGPKCPYTFNNKACSTYKGTAHQVACSAEAAVRVKWQKTNIPAITFHQLLSIAQEETANINILLVIFLKMRADHINIKLPLNFSLFVYTCAPNINQIQWENHTGYAPPPKQKNCFRFWEKLYCCPA